MPEIKHNFTTGKMNKDLDERLVPKGEYRDAMNIQVTTSEGSDVGTVQNILGNQSVSMVDIHLDSICVGSISDEKTTTNEVNGISGGTFTSIGVQNMFYNTLEGKDHGAMMPYYNYFNK